MRKCIYCARETEESSFTKEHILPRAIGGALNVVNPLFIDDVCAKCNNISGFFIDAPFTKSWFINNYRASHAAKYSVFSRTAILPLIYIGVLDGVQHDGKICETYLGPCGDTIYHFHDPYPVEADYPSVVGMPPHIKKHQPDPGFAFLFIASDNPDWLPVIINSFTDAFAKAKYYLGNGPTPTYSGNPFSQIPDGLKDLHFTLLSLRGKTNASNFQVDANLGDRFLAKMALGMGSLYLDESFIWSPDADLLRKYLWTRNPEDREKLKVRGKSYFSGTKEFEQLEKLLSAPGGHVLGILQVNNTPFLYANFYQHKGMMIQISNDQSHWKKGVMDEIIFFVFPESQKFVGPLTLAEVIAHRTGFASHPEVAAVEAVIHHHPPLPPFKI